MVSSMSRRAEYAFRFARRAIFVGIHVFDVLLLLVNALEDFWLLALALAFRHRLLEGGHRPLSKLFALWGGFFCGLTVHMRFMDGNCDREVKRPLRIKVKRGWMFRCEGGDGEVPTFLCSKPLLSGVED